MKTTLQLQVQDTLDALWLHLRPRRTLRITLYILLALYVLMIGSAIYGLIAKGEWLSGTTYALLASVYFAAIFFVFLPWKTRRIFKQQKTLHDPFTLELSDTGLFIDSPRGTMRMPWGDFHKWKASDKLILLYHSDRLYHLIPARAFSNDTERQAFLALLQNHFGSQRA